MPILAVIVKQNYKFKLANYKRNVRAAFIYIPNGYELINEINF